MSQWHQQPVPLCARGAKKFRLFTAYYDAWTDTKVYGPEARIPGTLECSPARLGTPHADTLDIRNDDDDAELGISTGSTVITRTAPCRLECAAGATGHAYPFTA